MLFNVNNDTIYSSLNRYIHYLIERKRNKRKKYIKKENKEKERGREKGV